MPVRHASAICGPPSFPRHCSPFPCSMHPRCPSASNPGLPRPWPALACALQLLLHALTQRRMAGAAKVLEMGAVPVLALMPEGEMMSSSDLLAGVHVCAMRGGWIWE